MYLSWKILQKLENRQHPLTSPSGSWSKRLGSFCSFLTQQQKRTTNWVQHWDAIPFSCNRKSWIEPHLSNFLSRLQTAQDDSVKPSTSSSLDIGKYPGIPPHKGSWYSVVDNKFSQTPQVVPRPSQMLQSLVIGMDPQLQSNRRI